MNPDFLKRIQAREELNSELIKFIKNNSFKSSVVPLKMIRRTVGPESNMINSESLELFSKRVKEAAKTLNEEKFILDPLLAVLQSDGYYYLLDSNHLYAALHGSGAHMVSIVYAEMDLF
jgi:hypothetical protein